MYRNFVESMAGYSLVCYLLQWRSYGDLSAKAPKLDKTITFAHCHLAYLHDQGLGCITNGQG
ncbi:hypothetical protein CFP56_027209 [Quercus suber]|uniref:Uncharacterized protein n=1 Tax=Quercus suber TaxID=58331 RepID=A0AAW0JX67_QUESU